jgi:RNA polymerase sigma factor (sigma-70 family)
VRLDAHPWSVIFGPDGCFRIGTLVTAGKPQSADNRVGIRRAVSGPVLRLQSDARLVALTRTGSEAAFGVIAERYRGPLFGYCSRLLGPDEAEDAVQQTFANALPALRRDDRPVQLRPWLYRIAHNLALNALNRRGRDYAPLDEQFDGVPQPPDVVNEKERLARLIAGIGALPERQRTAIVARELEGRSHEEIARAMQATTPVVRQLVHRARVRLRDACGVLVPVSFLRWVLIADPPTPATADRLGEAVAGGSAGAGLLKAGAVVLTTGALATGGGGLVAGKNPFVSHDRPDPAVATPRALDIADRHPQDAGARAPVAPAHPAPTNGDSPIRGGEASGRDHEGRSHGDAERSYGADREREERDGGDGEGAQDREADEEHNLGELRESLRDEVDGGSEPDAGGSGEADGPASSESPSLSEGSGSTESTGPADSPSAPSEGS